MRSNKYNKIEESTKNEVDGLDKAYKILIYSNESSVVKYSKYSI